MASTTIQVRVTEQLKRDAGRLYESIGLNTSSAIKLFMQQSVNTQSLPLAEIRCALSHELSAKKLALYEREYKDALKHGRRYTDVNTMFRDILKK